MNLFVTGATGFIAAPGRAAAAARGDDLRPGAGRLARPAPRSRDELGSYGAGVVPVAGDLSEPSLGVSEEDLVAMRGEVNHFFHLAAIYEITAGAEAQVFANVEGTRHALELGGRTQAGCFDQVSSIAAAGLYQGREARGHVRRGRTAGHETLLPTKHKSSAWSARSARALARLLAGDRGRRLAHGEIDKIYRPYYFYKALQRGRRVMPAWLGRSGSKAGRSTSSRSTTSPRRSTRSPTSRTSTAAPSTSPTRIRRTRRGGQPLREGADVPQIMVRLDSDVTEPATGAVRTGDEMLPAAQAGRSWR